MVLADEARSYFDRGGLEDREAMCPADRVAFSCESLKVTTRLMHVVSWLLLRRAADAGALRPAELQQPARSEEHTSELQSLMRISYAVFCLKKKKDHISTYVRDDTCHE